MLSRFQAHCGDSAVDAKVNERVAQFCAASAKHPDKVHQVGLHCTPSLHSTPALSVGSHALSCTVPKMQLDASCYPSFLPYVKPTPW